ncbi:unnamed protein product [Schistosoma turkestanicum]|nr:unnamed protein product [Schistosoma turkestanicum]
MSSFQMSTRPSQRTFALPYSSVRLIHKLLWKANDTSHLKFLTDSLLVFDTSQEFSLDFAETVGLKIIFLDTFVKWIQQFASSLSFCLNVNRQETYITRVVNNMVLETLTFIDGITKELKSTYREVPKPLTDFSNHLKFVMRISSKRLFGWIDYCCKLKDYCNRMLQGINFTNTSLTCEEEEKVFASMFEPCANTSCIIEHLNLTTLGALTECELMKDNLINHENSIISTNDNVDLNCLNSMYKLAYDKSNIIQIIQQVQTDHQNLNEADTRNSSSLVNIQKHLLKLSSIFITWATLRQLNAEPSMEQLQTTGTHRYTYIF